VSSKSEVLSESAVDVTSPTQTLQKLVHETYLQHRSVGGNSGRADLPI